MKTHREIAAALNIAAGILHLLIALGIFLVIAFFGGIIAASGEHGIGGLIGAFGVVIAGVLALLGLPSIVGGWALWVEKSWAKPLLLILSAFHLFHFPIGTALGVYTIWALVYEQPPTLAGTTPAATTPASQPWGPSV